MSYVIVGGICLVIGSLVGVGIMAFIFANSNTEYHVESIDKTKEEPEK